MNVGDVKNALYGRFQKNEDKQNSLALKAAHKALDIPEDMQVIASKTGIGALGAIGIALAAGIGPALLAGAMLLSGLLGSKPGAAPVPPAPVATTPPASPTPAPTMPPASDSQAFDEITEEKQPDGKGGWIWKEIDRQPFGVFPKKGPVP